MIRYGSGSQWIIDAQRMISSNARSFLLNSFKLAKKVL